MNEPPLKYVMSPDQRTVTKVNFLNYCAELWFQKKYMRFISEAIIKTPEGEFQIPSKKGNWYLTQLLGLVVESVEIKDKFVVVTAENDFIITIDTCLEPAGDNFKMDGFGKSNFGV